MQFYSIGKRGNLLYIVLNAQKLDEFLLIASKARLESLKMNHDRLDDSFVVILIAMNVICGAQNLSVDGSIVVDDLEKLV